MPYSQPCEYAAFRASLRNFYERTGGEAHMVEHLSRNFCELWHVVLQGAVLRSVSKTKSAQYKRTIHTVLL
jgi:hypothetical protein